MVSNFLRFVNTKGSSLPAHGRAGAPASPAKRGERATPFIAALFATCPPKPWRRREQKTEFGGGGEARAGKNSPPKADLLEIA